MPFKTETWQIDWFSCRLFEEHTGLLNMFSKFKELKTKEEQATSEELAAHANKVMETIDEGIRSLDELDVFFQYLHEIGASHTRIPGFTADLFWVSKIHWFLVVEKGLMSVFSYNLTIMGAYKLRWIKSLTVSANPLEISKSYPQKHAD